MPANNRTFWKKKLSANKLRDRLVTKTLRRQGWLVIRLWEHDLAAKGVRLDSVIETLKARIGESI